MNRYSCTYKGKNVSLVADSLYNAKLKAVEHFNVRKSKQHLVDIWLLEVGIENPDTARAVKPRFFYD